MNGLHPIKMPSAKEKVAAELRKAILSRQLQEGEAVTLHCTMQYCGLMRY